MGIAGAGDGEAGHRRGRAAQTVNVHRIDAVRHRPPRRRGGGDGVGVGFVTVGGAALEGVAAVGRGGGGRARGADSGPGREQGDPEAGRGRHCRRCSPALFPLPTKTRGGGAEAWRFFFFSPLGKNARGRRNGVRACATARCVLFSFVLGVTASRRHAITPTIQQRQTKSCVGRTK